jgi:hypothetical protein
MTCDLSELLEQTRPPDSELVDLIERAFLEGQIDGQDADLAYAYLTTAVRSDYCTPIRGIHLAPHGTRCSGAGYAQNASFWP